MFTVTPGGGSSSAPLVVSTTGVCTAVGNDITMTSGTGTCTVTASRAGDSNYNPKEVAKSATATKIAQTTLSVTSPNSGAVGNLLPIVTSGGTGSGALTFKVGTSTGCVISGGQLSIISGIAPAT